MTTNIVNFDMVELNQELGVLLERSYNPAAINQQVAQVLRRFVDNKFENQGPGWPALEPATIANRRGGGAGARMLMDTGALVNSIGVDFGVDFAEVFTNIHYSVFHVTGTRYMKRRDFFDIDMDAALALSAEIILDSIAR